ncbi:MAG: hypothetical protein EA411_13270 [Saprospirales bacterium]|nr:MAG: hypothetical protein EA411_13270 [Saprospirales bacterium]
MTAAPTFGKLGQKIWQDICIVEFIQLLYLAQLLIKFLLIWTGSLGGRTGLFRWRPTVGWTNDHFGRKPKTCRIMQLTFAVD